MVLKATPEDDEPWCADYVNYIVGKVIPPKWTAEKRKRFFSQVKHYFWDEPYAFRLCLDNIMRRCVAGNKIPEILMHCHSGPTGGHYSALITERNVYESGFFWPSNGYSQKDKNKAKTRQNQARDWKEREKSKPKAAPRNQDNKNKESSRRSVHVETSTSTAFVSCDGLGGYDWSDQDQEVIDSGCSRHMTGNMSYLTDYEEIDGRYVAFGGNPKGEKITGKGTIKTSNLDFENVYFVRELKFNLFSVSQMCDKKNSVLFNDTECIVLSLNFKLIDESQVLLRVPRKNNMYSVNLKNIVPKGGLTCLFDESKLWHRRLGHLNFKTMNKLVKGNLVRGLPSKLFENDQTCVACQKGKQHRASCKSKTENSISLPLHLLHMDLFGPTFIKSLKKKMYCLVVTDDYSRFTWVFFLATKDETSGILKSFITGIENLVDHKVKVIRCDNRTEFKNREMNQFCEMKGILRQFSVARTPQQNGVTERMNKTLIKAVRTMLVDSKLPTTFWAEAVNTACYVQNRVLVVMPQNKTPYELFHGRTLTLSFMSSIRCPVTILNTIDHLGKFDGSGPDWLFDIDALTRIMNYEPIVTEKEDNVNSTNNVNTVSSTINAAGTNDVNVVGGKTSIELPFDPNMPALEDDSIFDFSRDDEDDGAVADMNNLDTTIQVSPNPTTRIHKDHPLDQVIGDLQSATQTRKMSKNLEEHGFEEPKKVIHALKDPSWIEAMQEELLQFKLQEVWTLVDLPNRKRAIGSKWKKGINYDEVFIPIARIEAIRLFLAYASFKDSVVYQIDGKSDFLYGKIEEEVYVCQPPGFEDLDFLDRVYKVEKALYKGDILLVQVYVDDIIFGSTKIELCIAFEKLKHEKFQMKVKTASTPMETQKPLLKDKDGEEVDVHMYRSMIGSLMYLPSSRPDIMFVVCACARYQVNPKVLHLHAVKRIFRFLNAHPIRYALTINPTIYISCIEQFWSTVKVKTINGEAQLHALVDGKKIIVIKSSVRRDLQLADEEGVDCLPNSTIFKQLILMGVLRSQELRPGMSFINGIGVNAGDSKLRLLGITYYYCVKVNVVEDEAVHKELGESLVRATTTASSLEAEQYNGNITKTRSKATPNESSSLGNTLGGGPRGNTLQSDEDRLKHDELMALCTNLQNRVLDLEKTKTTQQNEIASLKRRGRMDNEESLGEDASKRGRIDANDADEEITLVSVQNVDEEMFDVNVLDGGEVFIAEQEVTANKENDKVNVVEELVEVINTAKLITMLLKLVIL
ncbi:putative ribonuclease H-like domain-containing protein, partial [Tanacetum coccineum]